MLFVIYSWIYAFLTSSLCIVLVVNNFIHWDPQVFLFLVDFLVLSVIMAIVYLNFSKIAICLYSFNLYIYVKIIFCF